MFNRPGGREFCRPCCRRSRSKACLPALIMGLLVAALLPGTAEVRAAPIPTNPIFTNNLRLRIPFHYDPTELKRLGAGEIRLYVSNDRGRTWQQSQTVKPDAGKFTFQAPGEGEYWFIVRSVDSRNREHPDQSDST